jgi:hypothetical protein
VYFNGIYNAKEAASRGDAGLRRGDDATAATFFATSAASAESVLARHPKSKWRPRALYLSGRGSAMAGYCEVGTKRLDEFLALPVGRDSTEFDRARLARSICELRTGKLDTARIHLDSLIDVKDREVARQARLWASRAALAARDGDAAERYLAGMNMGTMSWELLTASVSARDFVRVESLLVQRAAEADYRDDAINALRELLYAGRFDAVERIVNKYDAARVRENGRVAMHYLIGDYLLREGRDTVAQRHLVAARQMAGRDTVMQREAAARLMLLGIRRFESMRELDSAFSREDSLASRSPFARRLTEQALLVRLLSSRPDSSGASMFIAAEAARDSLLANPLAHYLFLRVARDFPSSPLAANALYAASILMPDSADMWRRQIEVQYPASHVAAWIRGEDPATRPDFATNQELLRTAWLDAARAWADTVRKLRAAQAAGRPGALP